MNSKLDKLNFLSVSTTTPSFSEAKGSILGEQCLNGSNQSPHVLMDKYGAIMEWFKTKGINRGEP